MSEEQQAEPEKGLRLSRHSTLVATVVLTVVAALYPGPGATVYSASSLGLIVALFALLGLTLRVSELKHGVASLNVHVAIQTFSLVATPAVFYGVFYRSGLAKLATGSSALATGAMCAMCLPVPTNTCVMFTSQAQGDSSVAAINAALGNLIGAFATPVAASLAVASGAERASDLPSTFLNVTYKIVTPLFGGLAFQLIARRVVDYDSFVPFLRKISTLVVMVFIYLILCSAFASDVSFDAWTVARLCAFMATVHIVVLATAWRCSASFAPKVRVAFVLTAPQKTESLGAAICAAMFDDDDYLAAIYFPIVIQHTIQMLFAAAAVSPLSRLAARDTAGVKQHQSSYQEDDPAPKEEPSLRVEDGSSDHYTTLDEAAADHPTLNAPLLPPFSRSRTRTFDSQDDAIHHNTSI